MLTRFHAMMDSCAFTMLIPFPFGLPYGFILPCFGGS